MIDDSWDILANMNSKRLYGINYDNEYSALLGWDSTRFPSFTGNEV